MKQERIEYFLEHVGEPVKAGYDTQTHIVANFIRCIDPFEIPKWNVEHDINGRTIWISVEDGLVKDGIRAIPEEEQTGADIAVALIEQISRWRPIEERYAFARRHREEQIARLLKAWNILVSDVYMEAYDEKISRARNSLESLAKSAKSFLEYVKNREEKVDSKLTINV